MDLTQSGIDFRISTSFPFLGFNLQFSCLLLFFKLLNMWIQTTLKAEQFVNALRPTSGEVTVGLATLQERHHAAE